MPYIDWDHTWEIGIESIDNQHKMLVNLINKLYENIVFKPEISKDETLVKRIVSPYKISLQTFASIRIKQT